CDGFTLGGGSSYFAGSLDAVSFYNRSLSANEVGDAFSAAVTIYDLDEPSGTTTFVNPAHNGFNATCTGSSCPVLGVPGMAYTAAQFDGVDDSLTINPLHAELARFVYDFESGVDPAWSTSSTGEVTRSDLATRFLGPV